MRHLFCLTALLLLCVTASALPVNSHTAKLAGTHYLQSINLMEGRDSLMLIDHKGFTSAYTNEETTTLYVFNLGKRGFIIVSADDRCLPILGYSMNGSYDETRLPTNMKSWLEDASQSIKRGILANAPVNKEYKSLWDKLADGTYHTQSTKTNDYLVTSTWSQGSGYNHYCPVFDGDNAVVGCVATAMAQIIRYWGYPSRGFGHKSYTHSYYGVLSADYDTVNFDYSMMPDNAWYAETDAEIMMISKLCYYCGVSVNMNYENPTYTSGSGAQTSAVPEGLKYFGYTDAQVLGRADVNDDDLWESLIQTEIDNLRPIEYSGHGSSGGHAFVLDGYHDRDQFVEYHFNWGWGGYSDGFYTLTTMQGFTDAHQMVTHIYPSGWDGHLEHFLVSPDGTGDGTSWDQANCRLDAAVKLNTLVTRDIWMKEGVYYGDTTGTYAYTFTNPVTIYGGFAGTETATSQRSAKLHPTIIDGQGERGLLKARYSSSQKVIKMNDIVLQNGHTNTNPCINLHGNIQANSFTIKNCQSDSSNIATLTDCKLRHSYIQGNQAPVILSITDEAVMRQSLVNNNKADKVVDLFGEGRVVNCDIVSNEGIALTLNSDKNTFINNIVWNNSSSILELCEKKDTTLRNNAFVSDTAIGDSTNILISANNDDEFSPLFTQPTTCGIAGLDTNADWHLLRGSVCIDKGERLTESMGDGDLDFNIRCRNGFIDLGCYETYYREGIDDVEVSTSLAYPNPATSTIHLTDMEEGETNIYDMRGRLVMQVRCEKADISHLPTGVYILQNGNHKEKLIKR